MCAAAFQSGFQCCSISMRIPLLQHFMQIPVLQHFNADSSAAAFQWGFHFGPDPNQDPNLDLTPLFSD
jgi:hypothetical protein